MTVVECGTAGLKNHVIFPLGSLPDKLCSAGINIVIFLSLLEICFINR
jgi:hypothetical protein